MKKGISLMVLVIIIVVMLILATAIVITITRVNSLDNAKEVTKENDIDKVQLMAELGLNEILKENNGNLSGVNVEEKLNSYLKDKNVDLNKYNIVYVAGSSPKNGTVSVSEITYIPIYTEDDLANIACDNEKELSDGNKYDMLNTAYYKLMNDITITKEFTPISRLNGRLYGNGKKIILNANYKVAECVIDYMDGVYAASLISVIGENGIVSNLGMEGTLDMSAVTTSPNIATIAGINIGTIDNCYSTVNITAGTDNSETGACIGGLVAFNANTIINSYNVGNITSYSYSLGGVAGYSYNIKKFLNYLNEDQTIENKLTTSMITKDITTKIQNSYNSGKILNTIKTHSDDKAGGIVAGTLYMEITSCYNSGDVTNRFVAGGIVGDAGNSVSVKDCYNKGKISNYNNGAESFVAGIVGKCDEDSSIYNCYNIGTIQATTGDTYGDIRQIAANQQNISASISKCYYLYSAGVEDDYATGVSDVYMKSTSFINTLNSNSSGAWKAVTSDYPKLSWE